MEQFISTPSGDNNEWQRQELRGLPQSPDAAVVRTAPWSPGATIARCNGVIHQGTYLIASNFVGGQSGEGAAHRLFGIVGVDFMLVGTPEGALEARIIELNGRPPVSVGRHGRGEAWSSCVDKLHHMGAP